MAKIIVNHDVVQRAVYNSREELKKYYSYVKSFEEDVEYIKSHWSGADCDLFIKKMTENYLPFIKATGNGIEHFLGGIQYGSTGKIEEYRYKFQNIDERLAEISIER